ncbi:MAG: hypothetical protein KKB50_21315 [Planctomycetes bacterium]|nr:hypothetical protein [Planctomycetota bacterium]
MFRPIALLLWACCALLLAETSRERGDASALPLSAEPAALKVAAQEPPAPDLEAEDADAASDEPAGRVVYRICRVTAYCDRGKTASGVPSGVGQCAAPGDIPFGATVYIPALDRSFVVTDRTARRFRRSTVDIFIPGGQACREFGRRYLECEFTLSASPSGR